MPSSTDQVGPRPTPRVWTEVALSPAPLARLQRMAIVTTEGTLEDLPDADVAVTGASVVDEAFLAQAGANLKMVARVGIGYEQVDVAACTAHGVVAVNTPDGPTESTAEHTVTLLLAIAKNLQGSSAHLRANLPWTRAALEGREVRGSLLGVVGFGRIGRRVSQICAAGLGMRVIVFDPFVDQIPAGYEGVTAAPSLDALLGQADFVSVHVPLTPETRRLIGDRELRLMKGGAYFINVSRGPIVDEAALLSVLRDGHLAGAALDVFDPEPPSPDNPLLHMDNVVVTPHVASNTSAGNERMSSSVVDQILQLLAGERPTFLIDPRAWPSRR